MTASAVLVLAVAIATGAALAAPVGLLEVTNGTARVVVPLDDEESLTYEYVQSIYNVRVIEEHRRRDGLLSLARVRSADIKAVEYFRWDGPIRQEGSTFIQDAPRYEVEKFAIRITAPHEQTLRTARWTLDLPTTFGESLVTVRPLWVPRALAYLGTRT